MKILHFPPSNLHLTKYGIQIPLTDDRDSKIYDFLKQNNIDVTLMDEGIIPTREDLGLAHHKNFLDKLYSKELESCILEAFELIDSEGKWNRYDPRSAHAPMSELFEAILLKTGGTMRCVEEALKHGEAFFLGGGFHHAMSFSGRGFCLINDIVIGARWAQRNFGVKTVWVIDVDAHKGDGTAELTQNDTSIKTLSIHMKEGWPLDSAVYDAQGRMNPWFIPSDVEIGIPQGGEGLYLEELRKGLERLEGHPDLAIVVQGSDPYEKDSLPSASLLKLTKEQMLQRDELVYDFLRSRGIPQAYVLAGGYGPHVHEIYCQFLLRLHTSSR